MKKQAKLSVELAGGLGNQLFQYAALLSIVADKHQNIQLEWSLGHPRLNAEGLPEICDYTLPPEVKISDRKFLRSIGKKTFGYLMRMSVAPKFYERIPAVRFAIKIFGGTILYFYFGTHRVPVVSDKLGYSKLEIFARKNIILIGYFQSFRYYQNNGVLDCLRALRLRQSSDSLENYRKIASDEKPLVVHFRFGDYKNESNFGIPDSTYYCEAIERLWRTGAFSRIWVFSDEIELAKEKFPVQYLDVVRWIEPVSTSSAENLEIMKLGRGYVIANSTYSYWAATLSYDRDAPVIAPSPWFRNMESPTDLIPTTWILAPAWRNLS